MPKQKVVLSVRLEPEYVEAITRVAKMRGITRVQLLREFAANAESLYNFLESERAKRRGQMVTVRDNLSAWVIDHMPEGIGADSLEFLSSVMGRAAQLVRNQQNNLAEPKEQK